MVDGKQYQKTCLKNGHIYVFQKIMKPVLAFLSHNGITCINYLHDIALLANPYNLCINARNINLQTLEHLGFVINYEKSHRTPTQLFSLRRFESNSVTLTIDLPLDERTAVHKLILIN